MRRFTKAKTQHGIEIAVEKVARDCVDSWIQSGDTTADMRLRRDMIGRLFTDFITRDIRYFAETGKYPQWAEAEQVKL